MRGKILSIVKEYAASVVKEARVKYPISEVDFRTSRSERASKIRGIVIRRLYEDGFSVPEIGRCLGFNPDRVIYAINPKRRTRKLARDKQRYAERVGATP